MGAIIIVFGIIGVGVGVAAGIWIAGVLCVKCGAVKLVNVHCL